MSSPIHIESTVSTHNLRPFPGLRGFDYIELFVGNVRHAAHYYRTVWGFHQVAFRDSTSDSADRFSIVMRQANIVLLLTGAKNASSSVAEHLHMHGEGVVAVGLAVDDVNAAYDAAIQRGASSITAPSAASDADGKVVRAEVTAFAGFTHVFVERTAYDGAFLPGFRYISDGAPTNPLFEELDHIAIAVEAGTLDSWVEFYQKVFGFELVHQEDVATEHTGMRSKVVQDPLGRCKFPIVEPVYGRRKSQVQDFLDLHNGPGVQHLALRTSRISEAVTSLRKNGVEFLGVPASYYDGLENRVGKLDEELGIFRELGILLDHDEWGRLLQVFARPCHDRPALFFEVVERRGARGFGGGNIRALFECIEREQALQSKTA